MTCQSADRPSHLRSSSLLRLRYTYRKGFRTTLPRYPVMIGLCGGIASGKSTISHALRGSFCYGKGQVFDADEEARRALSKITPALFRQFPFLKAEGKSMTDQVSRDALRTWIINDPSKIAVLEKMIFPHVREAAEKILRKAIRQRWKWLVWDIPLLWEQNYASWCHAIVFLRVPQHIRQARALKRMTVDQYMTLQQRQYALSVFRKRCDYQIVNQSDLPLVRRQMRRIWISHGILGKADS